MTRRLYLIIVISLFTMSNLSAQDQPPSWAYGAVWYQIFPERFRNGSRENDPTKVEVVGDKVANWQVHSWTSDWYKLQPWESDRNDPFYEVIWDRRYGGDLIGVIDKLAYLKELGVDVIYFNPVFEAPSLHKYDATTYHHIDNNFGPDPEGDWHAIMNEREDPATWTFTQADRTFLQLIQKAHEMGIKIVIDGVFNHSGPEFWALRDVKKNQQRSAYKDWFDVTSWDNPATPDTNEFDYKGWWGYKNHPEFKEDESGFIPAVNQYFYDVTRRWMDPNGDGDPSDGVDGWRLDVAEDVSTEFWEEWYQFVKSINPDAYLVGELWHTAADWIEKKRFDGLMNYPLAEIMVDFFIDKQTRISVSEFDRRLKELRDTYPESTNHTMMNLIDSHDTDRVASMIKNPDRAYNRDENVRNNPNYDPRKPNAAETRIQKLLVIFQMTYVGSPTIYYGDEAGMWGGKDPDCRKPMLWADLDYEDETYESVRPDLDDADKNRFDPDLLRHYRILSQIRHKNPAIIRGDFTTRLIDDEHQVYAFSRRFQGNEVLIALNNSDRQQAIDITTSWKHGTGFRDLWLGKRLTVENGILKLSLAPKWGAILVRE